MCKIRMKLLRDHRLFLLFIAMCLHYSYGALTAEPMEIKVVARHNGPGIFPCTIPAGQEKYQVIWTLGRRILAINDQMYLTDPRYHLQQYTPQDFTMIIDSAVLSDESQFTCMIKNVVTGEIVHFKYRFFVAVDGTWQPWNDWGECSTTCDEGTRHRSRECVEPQHGGDPCSGPASDSEFCMIQNCPVDGVFADWAEWGECLATCGNGSRTRERMCDGPYYGGSDCEGTIAETEDCVSYEGCPAMADVAVQQWGPRHMVIHVTLSEAFLSSTNKTPTYNVTYTCHDGRHTYKLEHIEESYVLLMDLDPNKKYEVTFSPVMDGSDLHLSSSKIIISLSPRGSVGLPLTDALGEVKTFESGNYSTFQPLYNMEMINPSHYHKIAITNYTGAECPHTECGMLKFTSPTSTEQDLSLIFHDQRDFIWARLHL